ncbi:MAG: glycerophosphodiester phosphodiesterase family protein [Ruminococcaceae bacterium]|nr:glycerophosphodiester phosphodiesterase family protein [Oscillospiraceae bacterium]
MLYFNKVTYYIITALKKEVTNMKFDLKQTAKEKMIIVAHRGVWSGNVPCNTIPAFNAALTQGADMIEIDVDMSADGKLFIFHPGMEKVFLNTDNKLGETTADEIMKFRYYNFDNTPTQYGLNTFEEILEEYKDKCYINVDKFWLYPREVTEMIRRHGMMDQILVKTSPADKYLDIIETYCPDVQYMAIVSKPEDIERVKARKLNYIGNEVIFSTDESPFASLEFIEEQHKNSLLVWCNSIVYNYRAVLSAGHNDDISAAGDPDNGWGWIADRGFDFMQTDWPLMAIDYLKKTGKLYRK